MSPAGDSRISVLIVHHETPDLLDACLASIERRGGPRVREILVLDNASDPPLPADFEARHPSVRLIRNPENVGYSRGVNQAYRAASGELLLILNPDIEVRGDAIEAMARFLDATPDAGIVGCRLLNADGSLQYSCRTFYDWNTLLYRRTILGRIFPNSPVIRRHLMTDWDHRATRPVDWLIGACLMVRREATLRVGLMDERFFMYFEDVDWCYRMSRAGYRVYYFAEAEMMHHHRRESARPLDRRFLVHLLSMLRYADKWNRLLWLARRSRETIAVPVALAVDLAAANLAFLGAFLLRNALRSHLMKPVFPIASYGPFILYMNAIVGVTFLVMGLHKSRVRAQGGEALGPVIRASFVAYLILTLTTFLTREIIYSRLVILAFLPLEVALVLALREALRRGERVLRRNAFDLRRVAIAGAGPAADRLRASLSSDPEMRFEIAETAPDDWGSPGGLEGLPKLIESQRLHDVVLADAGLGREEVERFLVASPRLPVELLVVPGPAVPAAPHAHLAEIGEQPVVVYERGTRFGIRPAAKRLLDLAIGVPAALLALPVVAILIALRAGTRGGPLEAHRVPAFGTRTIVLYSFRRPGDGRERAGWRLPFILALPPGPLSLVGVPPDRPGAAGSCARRIPPGIFPFWLWARSAPPRDDEDWERLARGYLLRWSPTLDLSIVLRSVLRGGKS